MKLKWKDIDPRWKVYALAACVAIFFYVVLTHLNIIGRGIAALIGFFLPVILGIVIAYVLNPLVKFLKRTLFAGLLRSHPRIAEVLSIVLTVLLVLVLAVLILVALIPQLVGSISNFIANIDTYLDNLGRFLDNLGFSSDDLLVRINEALVGEDGLLRRFGDFLSDNAGDLLGTVRNVGSRILTAVLACVLAIYFLFSKSRILGGWERFLRLLSSEKQYDRLHSFWTRFHDIFSRYVVYTILDAFLVGVVNYVFMRIVGLPNALLISVVAAVTNLAPTFGPIVGGIINAFILLLTAPHLVLAFIIFTIILQFLDGYILKPKMFGDALNLPAVLVLVAIIVGGRMFGVVGILIAIPTVALLHSLYKAVWIPRLEDRRARKNEEAAVQAVAAQVEKASEEAAAQAAREAEQEGPRS